MVTTDLCPIVFADCLWELELTIFCLDILKKLCKPAIHSLIWVERKESICFVFRALWTTKAVQDQGQDGGYKMVREKLALKNLKEKIVTDKQTQHCSKAELVFFSQGPQEISQQPTHLKTVGPPLLTSHYS